MDGPVLKPRADPDGTQPEPILVAEAATIPRSNPIAEASTIAPGGGTASNTPTIDLDNRDAPSLDGTARAAVPADGSRHVRYFGDYELIQEIARGGMGVVYRARQVSLNRPVALKMILAGQLASETDVRRFHVEAEASANLDHPGIVPIYEVGQHEGQHFFSMGFVEGQSLSQRLADGPLPAREAAELIRRVSEAIEYAHQHGVIHRDLKPANILLDRTANPRVTDFGLAKKVQGDSGLTGSGQIMGTPSYMPPEQAGGKRGEVGPAADVYALGATLYASLTGRPPFQAATAMDTVIQVVSDEPVPPRRLNASIPRDLETICLKCLEKGPSRRYASASALAADLGRYLAGEPISARPVTRSERAVKWARRRPAIAALLGLVTLVTALGLGGVLWQWRAALAARHVAEAQTELAEQRLYDVRMNLVQRCWEDNNGELLLQGLDEQLPTDPGGIDRRGFEWFYWKRKFSSGHITLKGHTASVWCIAYSPDGKRLASASNDKTVKVWDAAASQGTITLKGGGSAVFSPDGRRLAAAFNQTVKVWDTTTWQEALTLKGHTGGVKSVAFSPDRKRLASASMDQTVKVWDAATGQETLTREGPTKWVSSLAFSPDGNRLAFVGDAAVGDHRDGIVKVWDAATGHEYLTLKQDHVIIFGLSFSPDGQRLASGVSNYTVKVWDAATGQETLTLKGHSNPHFPLGAEGDPRWKPFLTPKGHSNTVYSVSFSPDGKRIASASSDRTVKVWDAAAGQVILTLKGHNGEISGVAYSPDGQRLASASADQTVKVWDAKTGQETLNLKGHTGLVFSVAFSPDGQRLASASQDGTVRVWDARPLLPELRVSREASSVLEFLIAQKLPAAEVLTRIGRDPTISDEVRQRARDLAEPRMQALASDEADRLVRSLFDKLLLKEDVLESLRADATLSEPVRREALRLAESFPDDPIADGAVLAHRGRRDEAAAAFARSFASGVPDRPDLWFEQAILRLAVSDAAGYRSACRHMLDVFHRTNEPTWLEFAAHAWALDPSAPDERAQALKLAERRASAMPSPWSDHVLGLALYRAGRFAEADARLRGSLDVHPGWDFQVLDWLVLAMAHQRLGQPDEARRWRQQAENGVADRLRGRPSGDDRAVPKNRHWRDGMLLHLLLREDSALVREGLPDLPDNPFAAL